MNEVEGGTRKDWPGCWCCWKAAVGGAGEEAEGARKDWEESRKE